MNQKSVKYQNLISTKQYSETKFEEYQIPLNNKKSSNKNNNNNDNTNNYTNNNNDNYTNLIDQFNQSRNEYPLNCFNYTNFAPLKKSSTLNLPFLNSSIASHDSLMIHNNNFNNSNNSTSSISNDSSNCQSNANLALNTAPILEILDYQIDINDSSSKHLINSIDITSEDDDDDDDNNNNNDSNDDDGDRVDESKIDIISKDLDFVFDIKLNCFSSSSPPSSAFSSTNLAPISSSSASPNSLYRCCICTANCCKNDNSLILLHCFHLICTECLTFKSLNMFEKDSCNRFQITCPLCGLDTADIFDKTIVLKVNDTKCQSCMESELFPVYFCQDCNFNLCQKCSKTHSFVIGCQRNDLKILNRFSKEVPNKYDIFCGTHKYSIATNYCMECLQFLCYDCLSNSSHSACMKSKLIPISTWLLNKKEDIKKHYKSITNKTDRFLNNMSFKDQNEFTNAINGLTILERVLQFFLNVMKDPKNIFLVQIHSNISKYLERIQLFFDDNSLNSSKRSNSQSPTLHSSLEKYYLSKGVRNMNLIRKNNNLSDDYFQNINANNSHNPVNCINNDCENDNITNFDSFLCNQNTENSDILLNPSFSSTLNENVNTYNCLNTQNTSSPGFFVTIDSLKQCNNLMMMMMNNNKSKNLDNCFDEDLNMNEKHNHLIKRINDYTTNNNNNNNNIMNSNNLNIIENNEYECYRKNNDISCNNSINDISNNKYNSKSNLRNNYIYSDKKTNSNNNNLDIINSNHISLNSTNISNICNHNNAKYSNNVAPQNLIYREKMVYKLKFGDFGAKNSNFTEPSGIASNKKDRIYIADTNNHTVKVLNIFGKFLFSIGSRGELLYPNRVAVDPINGNIVISERCPSHQIQVFSAQGEFLRRFGSRIIQYPRGLAVDNQSRVIVVECKIMRVVIFDALGNVLSKFECSRQFQFPNNVAVNDKEEIFISDNRLHRIQVFNYTGQFLRSIGHNGVINYPIGVEIDDDGNIVVADNHNNFNITIFDSKTGEVLRAFESKTKHAQCYDITLINNREIFMSSKDFKIYQYVFDIDYNNRKNRIEENYDDHIIFQNYYNNTNNNNDRSIYDCNNLSNFKNMPQFRDLYSESCKKNCF